MTISYITYGNKEVKNMYTYATEERHRQKLKENINKALMYKAEHNVMEGDRHVI